MGQWCVKYIYAHKIKVETKFTYDNGFNVDTTQSFCWVLHVDAPNRSYGFADCETEQAIKEAEKQ